MQTSLQSKRSILAYITYILGTSAVAMMLWLSSTVFIHTSCCKPHIPVKPENVMKLLQTPLFFSYCQHTMTKEIFPWHRVVCCPSMCVPTPTLLPPSLLKHSLQFILTTTTLDICSFDTFHQLKTVLTLFRRRMQDFSELFCRTIIIPRIVGVPSKKA